MKTISEIKEEFAGLDIIKYQEFRNRYQEDSRAGVQKLIEQSHKKEAALEAEKLRKDPWQEGGRYRGDGGGPRGGPL